MNNNRFPPSSTSSSEPNTGTGLTRYGSAPSSILTAAVDSVINGSASTRGEYSNMGPTRFFGASSETSADPTINMRPNLNDSAAAVSTTTTMRLGDDHFSRQANNSAAAAAAGIGGLQRSYGFPGGGSSSSSSLVRHSSSPAGFLNQLATAAAASHDVNGFSITSGVGSYNPKGVSDNGRGGPRLNSQLSFTRKEALSRIAEENENGGDHGFISDNNNVQRKTSTNPYGFGMGSWDEATNPITFSVASSKRPKTGNVDHTMESQFEFSMTQTLEMDAMDKLLHIPQDSVPCKIRAKRGCATHPRSIAERERRTRISGKLKKLQDLVPNMDKQTSYSDMLDLAVQHIKSLQNQVQKLNKEVDNCTCGCNKDKRDS